MASVGRKLTQKLDKLPWNPKKKSSVGRGEAYLVHEFGSDGHEAGDVGGEAGLRRRGSCGDLLVPIKNSKSGSYGSINSDSLESPVVDQDDILALTHDVRSFSDAMAKLKDVFSGENGCDNARVAAHEKLGEVLCILKTILQKYPSLHSTDVLTAAGLLISRIKNYNYEEETSDPGDFNYSIDQLALAFSTSVSGYLMGDVEAGSELTQEGKSRSFENLSSVSVESAPETETKDSVYLSGDEIDGVLIKLESGVNMALQRAKAWAKYAKDIMAYVEKRAHLEAEFAKGLTKLVQTSRAAITEESFLPFQSVYYTAMIQDVEYANTVQATCNLIHTNKFLEPLSARRMEHEKNRKAIKDLWTRELKKMQDAVTNLRKARSLYITRQQEFEKAKEGTHKAEGDVHTMNTTAAPVTQNQQNKIEKTLDKRKRQEDDAMHKAIEAETTYKACVVEANNRQQELEKVKANVLQQIRDLIYQCDQTMKAVTVGYFQLQHALSAPAPVQFQTLCENSRLYEPGQQYAEYVKRLPASSSYRANIEPFVFEAYTPEKAPLCRKPSTQSSGSVGSTDAQYFLEESPQQSPTKPRDKPRTPQPIKAWSHQVTGSDTESASGSSKSRDSSPSASPHNLPRRRLVQSASMDELAEVDKDTELDTRLVTGFSSHMSKAAQSHTFRKLRTPSKCRECSSYVYFQGAECEKCGLASHKKCLDVMQEECGHSPLDRRLTTFGVHISDHMQNNREGIPSVIWQCVAEIEENGMDTKGLYRVSGVKSRVEKVCESFETDGGEQMVDLSEQPANVVSNVLKLYLRQLPEPLMTFSHYPDFCRIAKEDPGSAANHTASPDAPDDRTIQQLKHLVRKLPKANYVTCAYLMHHLRRVALQEEQNQMNAANLGIVFGPTLLRPDGGAASLNSLMDTPHQTRAIELLILNAETIFGSAPPIMPNDKETKVEVLKPAPAGASAEPSNSSSGSAPLKLAQQAAAAPSAATGATQKTTNQQPTRTVAVYVENPLKQACGPSPDADHKSRAGLGGEMVLPGSALTDRSPEASKPAMTTPLSPGADGDESVRLDSDDELPDSLLPDDSKPSSAPFTHAPATALLPPTVVAPSTGAVPKVNRAPSPQGPAALNMKPRLLPTNSTSSSPLGSPAASPKTLNPPQSIPTDSSPKPVAPPTQDAGAAALSPAATIIKTGNDTLKMLEKSDREPEFV